MDRLRRRDRVQADSAPSSQKDAFEYPAPRGLPADAGAHSFEAADSRPAAYVHLYLGDDARGYPSTSEWIDFIRSNAPSVRNIQKSWPAVSESGQVWTKSQRGKQLAGHRSHPGVEISVRDGWRFFDPWADDQYDLWDAFEPSTTNRFSPDQIRRLDETSLPTHSEFYDRYRLVGIKTACKDGSNWGIVNFNGVASLRLRTIRP